MTKGKAAEPDAALLRRTARRLGLQVAAIVSVIVVVLTATALAVVLGSQQAAADTLLGQAISRAIDVLDPPAGVWLVARKPNGSQENTPGLPPGLPDPAALARTAATGAPEAFDLHLPTRDYRVQTGRRPDGVTVEAVLDLRADHAERGRLAIAMLVSGGLGLLLAAAAGGWLGRRATRPLSAALTLQRRFVSDASHELRTPLTLLSTRAQLLRRRLGGTEDRDARDAAHRVVDDAARLGAILDDLLMAARPTDAREHVPVDLVALAAEVAADAQSGSASVTVSGPQPRHDPHRCTVLGSPVALRRAVVALVDNATRHARRAVRISVRRTDRRVLLEVADDGPGVDPRLAPRLFHRFVSAHPPDAEGRRHYGLGLALVSEIATGHGGAVELIDSSCPGAVFRISLPAR